MTESPPIRLSICISTLNRAAYIGETLSTILPQLAEQDEMVLVDGASTDDTRAVVRQYSERFPRLRYFREPTNSGVDADYDKAVQYARGEYCWLMTDDDLLTADAITTVAGVLAGRPSLVIVNAEVRDPSLMTLLRPTLLPSTADRRFAGTDDDEFLATCGSTLSFIGCVVIRRDLWMGRERQRFFGSLFIHVGVIFQEPPVPDVRVIGRPLIKIRYGNAMWTPRAFEIWMFKWPRLIWSFERFSEAARCTVTRFEPYEKPRLLFWFRSVGSFRFGQWWRFLRRVDRRKSLVALAIVLVPMRLANALSAAYYLRHPERCDPSKVFELNQPRARSVLSAILARRTGFR